MKLVIMPPKKKQKLDHDGLVVAYNRNGASERTEKAAKTDSKKKENRIEELESKIAKLEGTVADLESKISDANADDGSALAVSPEVNTHNAMIQHYNRATGRD